MRFTKIKFDGKRIFLNYETLRDSSEPDKFQFESSEKPSPSFNEALQRLKWHIGDICELETKYIHSIEVRSVSFSYGGENDTMGATITGLKTLGTANAPLVINTPHLPTEDYSGNNPAAFTLSVSCIKDIGLLIDEANKYLEGEREQESMFPVDKAG